VAGERPGLEQGDRPGGDPRRAAAAGRVLFAAIPNVQPVTVMTVVAGVALGPRAGMTVGALAALVSNFYLGQGAYTPWQMLAWGGCGLLGGLAAPLLRRRVPLAVTCFALGFAFDAVMDFWEWLSFYPHTWQAFRGAVGAGAVLRHRARDGELRARTGRGPELRRLLEALRETPESGDRVGLRLLIATALAAATPVGFLQAHQAPTGAFAEPGGSPGPLLTAWAALGLRASGASTGDALDYLASHERGLPELTDVELVATAEAALGPQAGAAPGPDPRGAAAERPDRPDGELDDLGDRRAAAGA
jgi:hypothetical protein